MAASIETQVIGRALIRFFYIESTMRHAFTDNINVIYTEARRGSVYFHSPVVKLFSITELAIQGLKIVISLNHLLLQYQTNRAMAHSIRILHRSLFDCLLRISYLNRLDSQEDVGIMKKYLYSGVLDGFRKQCRIVQGVKDFLSGEPSEKAFLTCTDAVEELLREFDAEWFFEEARLFNVHEDELKEKPVLHFVKDSKAFSSEVEELRAIFIEHSNTVNSHNFERVVELCSNLGLYKKYYPKEGSKPGKEVPMHGSDWWPSSSALFSTYKKDFDENPIGMMTYYEALFHYNSSYVHPNINNAAERLSLEEEDIHVFWNQLVLLDGFEKLLYFSKILPKAVAHNLNAIEQETFSIFRASGLFGDFTVD